MIHREQRRMHSSFLSSARFLDTQQESTENRRDSSRGEKTNGAAGVAVLPPSDTGLLGSLCRRTGDGWGDWNLVTRDEVGFCRGEGDVRAARAEIETFQLDI